MRIDYPRAGRTRWTRFLPSWRQVLALGAAGFGLALATFGVAYAAIDVPDPNPDIAKQATIVYYDDGRTELGRFAELNRVPVTIDQVPEHLRYAVLSAEDRSFYDNRGISPRGLARALVNNARGGSRQGGSTITQQYVKNGYLTSERTLERKGKEFVVALKVDSELDKDEILENYLNVIFWGRGAYGVQAASTAYFGKPAERLTVSESAFLAGIIQSPSRYEPSTDAGREGAERRWSYVLDGMVEQGWLSADERARQTFPQMRKKSAQQRLAGPKGYLLDAVRRELLDRGFDEAEIEAGGLRVRSTFSKKAQDAAERAVREEFPKRNSKRVEVGLASVRPGDGAVVAMYGGADFLQDQVSTASQERTLLGSTVKPFTLAAALAEGRSLQSRYAGNSPYELPGGDKPVNNEFDMDYGETIDLYRAVEESVNTAFVDLTADIGPRNLRRTMAAAGLDVDNGSFPEPNVRDTLGTGATHPLDVAAAYATLAAGGVRVDPYVVAEVTGANGGSQYKAKPKQQDRVFGPESEGISADISEALVGVAERGTGAAARALDRPAAVKTGTHGEPDPDKPEVGRTLSGWFSGYTPQLATSVAYRREGKTIKARSLDGVGFTDGNYETNAQRHPFFGAGFPAATWTAYMRGALDGERVLQFPEAPRLGEIRNPVPSAPPTSAAPPTTAPPTSAPPTSGPASTPPTSAPPTSAPPTSGPPTSTPPTTPTEHPPTPKPSTSEPPDPSDAGEPPASGEPSGAPPLVPG